MLSSWHKSKLGFIAGSTLLHLCFLIDYFSACFSNTYCLKRTKFKERMKINVFLILLISSLFYTSFGFFQRLIQKTRVLCGSGAWIIKIR